MQKPTVNIDQVQGFLWVVYVDRWMYNI